MGVSKKLKEGGWIELVDGSYVMVLGCDEGFFCLCFELFDLLEKLLLKFGEMLLLLYIECGVDVSDLECY